MIVRTVLCICTYQRPEGLQRLLKALPALRTDFGADDEIEVVVIDNDAAHEGLVTVSGLPDTYPYVIHSGHADSAGISHARNAAVRLALTREPLWLAFLDDDEWPEPHWFQELHRVQRATGADAVGGPTRSVFPDHTDAATRTNPYYGADLGLPDGSACQLEAAGNFMIRASVVEKLGPDYFHPAFGESGGEDLAFFTRLAASGISMHWAANAVVHETVPASRLTPQWLHSRVVTIANSRVRVMQMLQPGVWPALVRACKTAALAGVALFSSMAGVFSDRRRLQGRLLRWKLQGKLSAHFGRVSRRGEGH